MRTQLDSATEISEDRKHIKKILFRRNSPDGLHQGF